MIYKGTCTSCRFFWKNAKLSGGIERTRPQVCKLLYRGESGCGILALIAVRDDSLHLHADEKVVYLAPCHVVWIVRFVLARANAAITSLLTTSKTARAPYEYRCRNSRDSPPGTRSPTADTRGDALIYTECTIECNSVAVCVFVANACASAMCHTRQRRGP